MSSLSSMSSFSSRRCCARGPFALLAAVLLCGWAILGVAATSDTAPPPARPAAPAAPATPAPPAAAAPKAAAAVGDPYPLATCPVAGEPLGDKAVILVHEGREFRFCCAKCADTFKAEPAKYIVEVDRRIIADQKAVYPMKTCLIMVKDELTEGETEDVVHNNRLFRFCCKRCVKKFNADPAKFWAELDAAVIAAQKPTYALQTCPVGGEKLGSHGEPVDMVVANRLIRLCCKDCKAEVRKNPAAVLAKVGK